MVEQQKEALVPLSKLKKDFSDWQVGNDYELIKQIGSGSYGQVVEAKKLSTGQKVAIKRMNNLFEDLVDCKRILREIYLLRLLKHENLIQIIEIILPKDLQNFDHLYVVTDYCQSDLKKLFKSPIHLELIHIQTLTYNILCALKYLHSAEVLHRDLKPANVLINEDCTVRVCDFGLARSGLGEKLQDHTDSMDEQNNINQTSYTSDSSQQSKKSKLQKTKKINAKSVKRELTGHVVTRWYRAPELILLEKEYTSAIDVWSVGCIFAELMNMIKENAPTYLDRAPLFPGNSCFPLSPAKSSTQKKGEFPHSQTDQLTVIFEIIGTPTEEDYGYVTDEKAVEYIKSFSHKKKTDFTEIYPAATPECIDFMLKTITFNPEKRITIDQALNHPLFKKVRDKNREKVAEGPCILEFEKEGDLSAERLRDLFVQQLKYYQKPKK